jgi:hypothetical protein
MNFLGRASTLDDGRKVIYLSSAFWLLGRRDRLATLYHEFSHSFGGTDDAGGYQDRPWGIPGFYHDAERKWLFSTTRQLINSADSYAGLFYEYLEEFFK